MGFARWLGAARVVDAVPAARADAHRVHATHPPSSQWEISPKGLHQSAHLPTLQSAVVAGCVAVAFGSVRAAWCTAATSAACPLLPLSALEPRLRFPPDLAAGAELAAATVCGLTTRPPCPPSPVTLPPLPDVAALVPALLFDEGAVGDVPEAVPWRETA